MYRQPHPRRCRGVMTEESPLESWTVGAPYERYVGRWSRKVAALFLPWLAVGAEARWGDVGCGTGALIETILRSFGDVAHARAHVQEPRVRLVVGEATTLPWKNEVFDATVSGLVLKSSRTRAWPSTRWSG